MREQLVLREHSFKRADASDELEAAGELARDGLPVNDIFFLTRGVVSKLVLLRADAKA